MDGTNELIDALATDLAPVRRLAPPILRCARWLALAAVIVAILGVSRGARPDLLVRFHEPLFALRIVAVIVTAVLAAASAFLISQPDRSDYWALLPLPGIIVWLLILGYGSFTDWVDLGPEGVPLGRISSCLTTLVLTGVPLAATMALMMRRSKPLRPLPAALNGALAVAAISVTALSLFHSIDESILVLIANIGVATLFLGFGLMFAGNLYRESAPT